MPENAQVLRKGGGGSHFPGRRTMVLLDDLEHITAVQGSRQMFMFFQKMDVCRTGKV